MCKTHFSSVVFKMADSWPSWIIQRLLWNFTVNNYMVGRCAWHIFFDVTFKMADWRPSWIFSVERTSTVVHRLLWNVTINNYMVGSCDTFFSTSHSKWPTGGHLGFFLWSELLIYVFTDCYETSQLITTWWVVVRDTFFSTSHSRWPTGGHFGSLKRLWSKLLLHFSKDFLLILMRNFTVNNFLVQLIYCCTKWPPHIDIAILRQAGAGVCPATTVASLVLKY